MGNKLLYEGECHAACSKITLEVVVGIAMVIMVLSQISYLWDRMIFAHDELTQLHSYWDKLQSEGRWLNYVLFPVLQHFNVYVAVVMNFLCVGLFGYVCAGNWLSERLSLLVALLFMLSPSVAFIIDWPLTVLPSLVLLALAALAYKRMSDWLFFPVFGLLFNGVLSNVYFLLPLLFLAEGNIRLVRIFLLWIGGYVVGVAFAEIATWLVCGDFIQLAEWRNPRPVHSIQDAVRNSQLMFAYFDGHLRYLGKLGAFVTLCALFVFVCQCRRNKSIMLVLMLGVVMLSCYAQAFPLGILVSYRTVHALYMAIFLFVIISFAHHKRLLIISVMLLALQCLSRNSQMLNYQNELRETSVASIKQMGIDPVAVEGVVLLADESEIKELENLIIKRKELKPLLFTSEGMILRWKREARFVGFKSVWMGKDARRKLDELAIEPDCVEFETKGLYRFAVLKNHLIVTLSPGCCELK